MICTSNIPAVVERLKRWQAGLPEAVARALSPTYWTAQLKMVAGATIQAHLAQWSTWMHVDANAAASVMGLAHNFIDSVRGGQAGAIAEFTAVWGSGAPDVLGIGEQMAIVFGTGQMLLDLDPQQVEQAKQAVLRWAQQEKQLSQQDDYDPETAAQRVQSILGLTGPPPNASPEEWMLSQRRQEAAQGLAAHIQDFLQREDSGGGSPLTPEAARQILAAVLLAWREYVQTHLRDRLELELNRLNGGLL